MQHRSISESSALKWDVPQCLLVVSLATTVGCSSTGSSGVPGYDRSMGSVAGVRTVTARNDPSAVLPSRMQLKSDDASITSRAVDLITTAGLQNDEVGAIALSRNSSETMTQPSSNRKWLRGSNLVVNKIYQVSLYNATDDDSTTKLPFATYQMVSEVSNGHIAIPLYMIPKLTRSETGHIVVVISDTTKK